MTMVYRRAIRLSGDESRAPPKMFAYGARSANTGLSNDSRVILRPALKHLDDAADFLAAAEASLTPC
jgi:hypothetical protein